MPVYRQEKLDRKWGSKRLFLGADAERRPTAMDLGRLGKIRCRLCPPRFKDNDRKVLVNAISLANDARTVRFGNVQGAAVGAAVARAPKLMHLEVRKYLGRVKSLEGDNVIAEIGPPDDMDRWDVVIPRATFNEQPQINQEIGCRIVRYGSRSEISVQVLSKKPLPELKDFGINEEELLNWASQLDV